MTKNENHLSPAEQTKDRHLTALKRSLGQDLLDHLANPKIVEIMLNPDGKLWIDELGGEMRHVGELTETRSRSIVDQVASMLDTIITEEKPILECELPLDGSRFEALIPPLVSRTTFTLRKKALLVFTLEDYVAKGIMTKKQKEVIEQAIADRQNILVVGGTGTGKTTLANAIIDSTAKIDPHHRIVVIEDTRELQVNAANVVFLRTADNTDMTRLLRATMRLRPDRIIVGEVRDGSALALLKAWNTGHPGGIGTVHANDSAAGLIRIEQLIQEVAPQPQHKLIAEAVNVVVSIERTATGRRIKEVMLVKSWSERDGYEVEHLA